MLNLQERNQLRKLMSQHFNTEELRDLCFTLGIEYENLGSDTKSGKIRELIAYCQRHACLGSLLNTCRQLRPHVQWPTLPTETNAPSPPDQTQTPPPFTVPATLELDFQQKAELVQALLDCPSMNDRGRRDAIVSNLPAAIKGSVVRDSASSFDVTNILDACLQYQNGLAQLIQIIRFYENNSLPMQRVEQTIAGFLTDGE